MKKNTLFIAPIIVLPALLFTALTYYSGRMSEYEIEQRRLRNSVVRLEDKLMKQVSAIRYKLPDSIRVYDVQKEHVLLASVAETGPRKTDKIKQDIIQLSQGPFSRTIELRTSNSDAPYMLSIKENVV